jgi:hypothetical protein
MLEVPYVTPAAIRPPAWVSIVRKETAPSGGGGGAGIKMARKKGVRP